MIEEWRECQEFPAYEVSNTGKVRNQFTLHELAGCNDSHGYPSFWPKKDGRRYCRRIHRCVAQAFLPNPDALPEVNHIDGNKANNRLDNLEWVTSSENKYHAYHTGLRTKSSDRPVLQIQNGRVIARHRSLTQAARDTGVGLSNISMAVNGYTKTAGGFQWKYVKEENE